MDVPLSYGVSRVEQPAALNELHVHWDPTKDVGVYVKVRIAHTHTHTHTYTSMKYAHTRDIVHTYYILSNIIEF